MNSAIDFAIMVGVVFVLSAAIFGPIGYILGRLHNVSSRPNPEVR